MMAHPADPDLAVRYARVAAEHGQTRAAIAALERVLRLHPELDNLRLSLASLYYAENNPALASVYANQALKAENIPPEAAEQGRALANTAASAAGRSKFAGSVSAGPAIRQRRQPGDLVGNDRRIQPVRWERPSPDPGPR